MRERKWRRLLNVVTVGHAIGFRRRDVIVRKRKLIGGGPEVGEFAFVCGRRDGAVGAAVTTEVGALRVGAIAAITDVRSVRVAVNVSVLLQCAR